MRGRVDVAASRCDASAKATAIIRIQCQIRPPALGILWPAVVLAIVRRAAKHGTYKGCGALPAVTTWMLLPRLQFSRFGRSLLSLITSMPNTPILAPEPSQLPAPCGQEIARTSGSRITAFTGIAIGSWQQYAGEKRQLMGLEGVIISRREDRLLIGVRFLRQGVSIQIQDFQVESI